MIDTNISDKRYGVPPVEPCQAGGALGSSKAQSLTTGTARSGTSRWFQKGTRKQGKRKKKENFNQRKKSYDLSSHHQHKEQEWKRKKLNQSINIFQANICGGLHIKKVELAKLFKKEKIHVAMLQEARHRNVNYDITGYTSYPCDCKDCLGIITYIRNDVTGDVSPIPIAHPTDVQKVTIWYAERKYELYNVYNSPKYDCKLPNLQDSIYNKTIIAGDFNGHSPLWGYANYNNTGKFVEELCGATNLFVHQTPETKETLLHRAHLTLHRPDLTILSADLENICHIEVLDDIGSDHRPTLISIMTKEKTRPDRRARWNFRRANWNIFKELSDTLLSNIEEEEPEQFNDAFVRAILKASSQSIPRGSVQHYKPFWTPTLEEAVKVRKEAREKLEMDNAPVNRTAYQKACAEVKLGIKAGKKHKWQRTTADLDLEHEGTKAWKLLNHLSGENKRSNPKPMDDQGTSITTDQKKAEHMNRAFASVSRAGNLTDQDKEILRSLKQKEKSPTANNSLFEEDLTKKELKQALRKIKQKKAPGPDKIHGEMLKRLGAKGKDVLLQLINSTWRRGQVPRAWKIAHIIPIPKKGKDHRLASSFRPISLTSCVGKVAERMINHRLYWFLETSKNLGKNQAGFRKGKSTVDQLFRLTQRIHDGFQSKKHTLGVFVDLQQAYDRVWRKGLLVKLNNMGIHGNLYNWIKFYLIDRTIQTKVNDSMSSKEVLEEGLPQGSCLSSTLFLVYIKDLEDVITAENALYADDLTLWATHSDISMAASEIRRNLKRLENYCERWKIKISEPKTVYTIFTKSHKVAKEKIILRINKKNLLKEQNPTYLGIKLDRQLTLNQHLENLKSKASKRLRLLKKLATTEWGSDKTTLRNLYLGYVRSSLEYGAALMTTCSTANLNHLDRIQNSAARFINGGMRSTPTSASEIHADITPLRLRREKATMELFEKCKREETSAPNRRLVDSWQPQARLKQMSVLHKVRDLSEKHDLPTQRQEITTVMRDMPPHMKYTMPGINMSLVGNVTKKDDPVTVLTASLLTIDKFPDDWIHVYTDGSATRETRKAGYGVYIRYPDGSSEELSEACGTNSSNYDAEIAAIENTLIFLKTQMQTFPLKKKNIVIFTDAMSALQSLEENAENKPELKSIIMDAHELMHACDVEIFMQWIPGHSDTPGNDRADRLAKRGSEQPQPQSRTTYETAKAMIRANIKEEWQKGWENAETGRELYKYMKSPKKLDPVNALNRKDQSTIFRMRTQHIALNKHLHRIGAHTTSACPLCDHPEETIDHHLFHCAPLEDLRRKFLSPPLDKPNVLFGNISQLKNTCNFHNMAIGRRAKAQNAAG